MDQPNVFERQKKAVAKALRYFNNPRKLANSEWATSMLVKVKLASKPELTPFQAMRAVFTETMALLAEGKPDYADLLRGRFWEEKQVNEMRSAERPWPIGERSFYDHQDAAIEEFTHLLIEKDDICRRQVERATSEGETKNTEVVAAESTPHYSASTVNGFHAALKWIREHSKALLILALLVIPLCALSMIATQMGSHPTPTSVISMCKDPHRVTASSNPFIRSQGVSAFTVDNTHSGVLNDNVRVVAIDSRGLWIGYLATKQNSANGIGFYDKKTWGNYNQPGGTAGKNVNAILVDQLGNVWIASEKDGVLMFDGRTWHSYTTSDGLPSNNTYGLALDRENRVLVGTWEGVAEFDGQKWTLKYSVKNRTIFTNDVHAIAFDSAGNTWIGHVQHGVSQRTADNKWVLYQAQVGELGGNEIRGIAVRNADATSSESIWFATADGGISKFEQGKWTTYRCEDGLPSNDVRAIAVDKYNRIWAATASGVVYFENSKWIIYDTVNTLSLAFGPQCVHCPFDDDQILTGTAELGVTHSRVPYPNAVDTIKITQVCFESQQKERICQSLEYPAGTETVRVTYPYNLHPNEKFHFEITVVPQAPYELSKQRGDFMSNTDDGDQHLFGAYWQIAVKRPEEKDLSQGDPLIVKSNVPFTFVDYNQPLNAPELAQSEQQATYTSTWRVWTFTRYAGPYIQVVFTVK